MHWSRGTWQLSSHHTNTTEPCSPSCNETLSVQHSFLSTGYDLHHPGSETSQETFLRNTHVTQWWKWGTQFHCQVLEVLDSAGQSSEGSKSCFTSEVSKRPMSPEEPLQFTALWVCGSACEQLKKEKSRLLLLKNCTEVKLKPGKQAELRAAGSHRAAADSADKHGGRKGKKMKEQKHHSKTQMDKLSETQSQLQTQCQSDS